MWEQAKKLALESLAALTTLGGLAVVLFLLLGLKSCVENDFDREAACISAGGTWTHIGGGREGCYRVTVLPIDSVRNWRQHDSAH